MTGEISCLEFFLREFFRLAHNLVIQSHQEIFLRVSPLFSLLHLLSKVADSCLCTRIQEQSLGALGQLTSRCGAVVIKDFRLIERVFEMTPLQIQPKESFGEIVLFNVAIHLSSLLAKVDYLFTHSCLAQRKEYQFGNSRTVSSISLLFRSSEAHVNFLEFFLGETGRQKTLFLELVLVQRLDNCLYKFTFELGIFQAKGQFEQFINTGRSFKLVLDV